MHKWNFGRLKVFYKISDLEMRFQEIPLSCIMKQIQFSGYSMYPTVRNGDILFLQSIPMEQIKKGNIICIPKNDIYVTHRVSKIKEQNRRTILILKGDNLKHTDPPLSIEDKELYKVILLKRNHKKLLKVKEQKWRAWLSMQNLTYGIIRTHIGKTVKWTYRIIKKSSRKMNNRG